MRQKVNLNLKEEGSVPAAVLMNMEPVVTVTLAIIISGEQRNKVQLMGVALVIGAVFAVTLRPILTER